jgi:hypothetical protein
MSTRLPLVIALVIAGVLFLPQAAGAQVATEDSATGSGATPSVYSNFAFSATSDPLGGSPSGSATWSEFGFHFEGTVSCLAVNGNRGVIGIDVYTAASSLNIEGFVLTAVDGGPPGSGLDVFDAAPLATVPTDCTVAVAPFAPEQVTVGDIVVVDAPPLPTSKDQCKDGGWRTYGVFKNQGDCVSFVATGGNNPPAASP